MFKNIVTGLIIGLAAFGAQANWAVSQSESAISFVSIKKQHIAEVHHFNAFEGTLTKNGKFDLSISLASVDTGIAIRDLRMKTFLFDVSNFAKAKITADVSNLALDSLAVGASVGNQIAANLTIGGIAKPQVVDVMITRTSADSFVVTSTKPLIIKASDYLLIGGINKLRELAKLSSISHSVPLSFTLTLRK